MTTMHAVTFDAPGPPDVLRLGEAPAPTRLGAEVLVAVHAAGVNPVDALTRAGEWPSTGAPAIPGADFAGIVVESPYVAHPLAPGAPVYGVTLAPRTAGSYAEYVSVPSMCVARMPRRLSFAEAAAVPLAALTAWGLVVETARAHEGQRILIHGGAGGVGHLAVQLAHFFGAEVLATAAADELDFVRDLGAHHAIDYAAGPFEDEAGRVDVVIDLVGNASDATGSRSIRALRSGGLYATAASAAFPTMLEEADEAGVRATDFRVSPDAATLGVITRLIDARDLRVHVDRVLPLAEAAEAHRLLEQGRTRGKLVLRVVDDAE